MKILLLGCLAVGLLAGCSSGLLQQGNRAAEEGKHDQAIDLYYREIAVNPQSMEAWRGLGAAFYKKGDLIKAEDALKQANTISPDATAHLYIGLIREQEGKTEEAIAAYGTALSLDPQGETRNLLRAHVDRLLAERMKLEVDQALAGEGQINAAEIPENTIAVADFEATGLNPDLAPLARGLAEFTASDLAKVKSLRVVDRLKIDAIMNELKLAQSGAVDQASAPRVGRLLGSRNVVTATVLGLGEDQFRLDGVIVNTVDSTVKDAETKEGQLRQLFGVQKEFVFRVIDDLGIELTAEERDEIAKVPTESFLAFMAYSRGLDYQQRGMLKEAQGAFGEATTHDPGFNMAAAKAAAVNGALALGGNHTFGAFQQQVFSAEMLTASVAQLDGTLSDVARNIGNLPNLIFQRPAEQPPVTTGTVTVVVRGNLNGN